MSWSSEKPVVLFDGVCNLCNASVNFLIDHDRRGRLRFAALQSDAGRELLQRFSLPVEHYKSLVLVEGDQCYLRSTAALRIARHLDGPWYLATVLLLVPTLFRDAVYDLIAGNRYRLFGKSDTCRMPTPELLDRFLK